jgi:hypothetical protein
MRRAPVAQVLGVVSDCSGEVKMRGECCLPEAEEEDGCQGEFLAKGEPQLLDHEHGEDACDEVLQRAEADYYHERLHFVMALPCVRAHPRRREAVPVGLDGPAGE